MIMTTTFGYAEFTEGMHFIFKGIEYIVNYYGFIPNNSPFDPFGGRNGVVTTTGEIFYIPQHFYKEIEIL